MLKKITTAILFFLFVISFVSSGARLVDLVRIKEYVRSQNPIEKATLLWYLTAASIPTSIAFDIGCGIVRIPL